MTTLSFAFILVVSLHTASGDIVYTALGEARAYDEAISGCQEAGGWLPRNTTDDSSLITYLQSNDLSETWLDVTRMSVTWYLPDGQGDVLVHDTGCYSRQDLFDLISANESFVSFTDCLDHCGYSNFTYAALQSDTGCHCITGLSLKHPLPENSCATWCTWFPECGSNDNFRILSSDFEPQGSCVKLTTDGSWEAAICEEELPVICEFEIWPSTEQPSTVGITEIEQSTTSSRTSPAPTPTPTSPTKNRIVGIVVTSVAGTVTVLILVCAICYHCRKRKQAYKMPSGRAPVYVVGTDHLEFDNNATSFPHSSM